MSGEATDELCVTIAMLDGAVIDRPSGSFKNWFVWRPGEPEPIKGGCAGATLAAASRKYCERHNLLR